LKETVKCCDLNKAIFLKQNMLGGAYALSPSYQLASSLSLQLANRLVPTILGINVQHTNN
jgi:hypothetical protein